MHINTLVMYFNSNFKHLGQPEANIKFNEYLDKTFKTDKKSLASYENFYTKMAKFQKKYPDYLSAPVPAPPKMDAKEKAHRAKLQQQAYEISKKFMLLGTRTNCITQDFLKYRNGKTFDRILQAYSAPVDANMTDEEIIQLGNDLQTKGPEFRREYILNKFRRIDEAMKKVSQAQSDEEFLDIVKDNYQLIAQAAELQMTPLNVRVIEEFVGGKLDSETYDLWCRLSRSVVGLSGEATARLGLMANPTFITSNDRETWVNADLWLDSNTENLKYLSEKDAELKDFFLEVCSSADTDYLEEREAKFGSDTSSFRQACLYGCFWDKNTIDIVVKDGLEMLMTEMKVKSFKDKDGNDLTEMEALDKLMKREEICLYNAQGIYQGNTKIINDFSTLFRPDKHRENDLSTAENRAKTKKELQNLQKQLKSSMPWYKRIGGAYKKSEHGQALTALTKLNKQNFEKMSVEEIKAQLSQIQNHLQNYVDSAKGDAKEPLKKVDATNKAIESLMSTVQAQEHIESRAQILGDDISLENVNYNYTLQEAIEIYEKRLAQDPKYLAIEKEEERKALIAERRRTVEYELSNLDKNEKITEVQLKGIDQLAEKRLHIKQIFQKNCHDLRDAEVNHIFAQMGRNLEVVKNSSQDKLDSLLQSNKKALVMAIRGKGLSNAEQIADNVLADVQKENVEAPTINNEEKLNDLKYEYVTLIQQYMAKYDAKRVEQALDKMADNPEKLQEKVDILNQQKQHVDFGDLFEEEVASADNIDKSDLQSVNKQKEVEQEGVSV